MSQYRTFWRRFFAGWIDGFVLIPLTVVVEAIRRGGAEPALVIAGAVIAFLGWALYSVLMHARFGQTLGKMATGVQVLDLSETRIPTLKQAFLRDIGYIALNVGTLIYMAFLVVSEDYVRGAELNRGPGQILDWAGVSWFVLEVVSLLTNAKRRALHDFIASTVVVRKSRSERLLA